MDQEVLVAEEQEVIIQVLQELLIQVVVEAEQVILLMQEPQVDQV
jgi:hypothetical protein